MTFWCGSTALKIILQALFQSAEHWSIRIQIRTSGRTNPDPGGPGEAQKLANPSDPVPDPQHWYWSKENHSFCCEILVWRHQASILKIWHLLYCRPYMTSRKKKTFHQSTKYFVYLRKIKSVVNRFLCCIGYIRWRASPNTRISGRRHPPSGILPPVGAGTDFDYPGGGGEKRRRARRPWCRCAPCRKQFSVQGAPVPAATETSVQRYDG